MKQHITREDLEQLSSAQAKALYTYWWLDQFHNRSTEIVDVEYQTGMIAPLPLMTIGDMIEFLYANKCNIMISINSNTTCELVLRYGMYEHQSFINKELCDVLWGTVKYVLSSK